MAAERITNQEYYSKILFNYLAAKAEVRQVVIPEPAPAPKRGTLRTILFSRFQPLSIASTQPLSIEEETKKLEDRFKHQVYSNRKLLVCHLKANPDRQEGTITDYLNSPELLSDRETLGQFLSYWLLEFFQQVDTGSLDHLLNFIHTADPFDLPRDLQRAKKDVFDPIFKLLNSEQPGIIEKLRKTGIPEIGFEMAITMVGNKLSIPLPVLIEYQKYVKSLVCLEANILKTEEKAPLSVKVPKYRHPPQAKDQYNVEETPQNPPFYSLSVISGKDIPPTAITSLEDFKNQTIKVNFGNIPPEDVWSKLQKLTKMTPKEISIHYRDKVAGGPYQGWTQIHIGTTLMRIIFSVNPEENTITFKIGRRETIYETKRRKGKDKSRTL